MKKKKEKKKEPKKTRFTFDKGGKGDKTRNDNCDEAKWLAGVPRYYCWYQITFSTPSVSTCTWYPATYAVLPWTIVPVPSFRWMADLWLTNSLKRHRALGQAIYYTRISNGQWNTQINKLVSISKANNNLYSSSTNIYNISGYSPDKFVKMHVRSVYNSDTSAIYFDLDDEQQFSVDLSNEFRVDKSDNSDKVEFIISRNK